MEQISSVPVNLDLVAGLDLCASCQDGQCKTPDIICWFANSLHSARFKRGSYLNKWPPGFAKVIANKAAGDAFRDEIATQLTKGGYTVDKEVYFRTPFGKRYIDIDVWKNGQRLGGIETKVGSSRYTWLQQVKDRYIWYKYTYKVNVVRKP